MLDRLKCFPNFKLIDLKALRYNLEKIREKAPGKKILGMVKSDAYGHGLLEMSKTLEKESIDALGVSRVEEAMNMRQAGISQRIVIFGSYYTKKQLEEILLLGIEIVVFSSWQLDLLEKITLPKQIKVWIKINSGLNRLGFEPERIMDIASRICGLKTKILSISVIIHPRKIHSREFSQADQCVDKLKNSIERLQIEKSISNSRLILSKEPIVEDWVRPGLLLYGVSPDPDKSGLDHDLIPVMKLNSWITSVRKQKKGDKVGYDGDWTCPEDMSIGTASIGYAHGLFFQKSDLQTPVYVGNSGCSTVGKISMEMVNLDLRNAPQASVGDLVTIWGGELPIEVLAKKIGTIPNYLLTNCDCTKIFINADM